MYTTLINTSELLDQLENPKWVIIDCRYQLSAPDQGESDYLRAHIPGAVYTHLDRDLSSPVISGATGRHPLPTINAAADLFSRCGIDRQTQVVAYDDAGGAVAAVRAWWLLRWLGHEAVAVLNGGWGKWVHEGHPVLSGRETNPKMVFIPEPQWSMLVNTQEVVEMISKPGTLLLDSRSEDRYHGENETIDPVGGHIPGAVSVPYAGNLNQDGSFLTADQLRDRFQTHFGSVPAEEVVFYCGSGVTANHNILAVLHAGLGSARLYPGSWSEWITDPNRPIAV